MKVLNKIAIGASFGALAIALAGGVDASAAGETPSSGAGANDAKTGIEVLKTKEMKITPLKKDGTKEVYVSFDYLKKDDTTVNKKPKWDVYATTATTDSSIMVDLSNVKTKKTSYVAVKQEKADKSGEQIDVIKITEDKTKYKGKIKASNLEITGGAANDVFTYRTEMGEGKSYTYTVSDTNFKDQVDQFGQQGATLYFSKDGNKKITLANGASQHDGTYTVYTINGSDFNSAEFKVKVPKAANAPTIPVDYTKAYFKKKSGLKYREAADVDALYKVTEWKDLGSANYNVTTSGGIIQFRTEKSGKAPSKIAAFSWDAFSKTTAQTINASSTEGTLARTGAASGSALTYKKGAAPKKEDAAIIELTATDADYLLYKAGNEPAFDAKADVTVKKGRSVKVKKSKLAGKVWIRTAGNKKDETFPSVADQLQSDLPYPTVAPTAAPTGSPAPAQ